MHSEFSIQRLPPDHQCRVRGERALLHGERVRVQRGGGAGPQGGGHAAHPEVRAVRQHHPVGVPEEAQHVRKNLRGPHGQVRVLFFVSWERVLGRVLR